MSVLYHCRTGIPHDRYYNNPVPVYRELKSEYRFSIAIIYHCFRYIPNTKLPLEFPANHNGPPI